MKFFGRERQIGVLRKLLELIEGDGFPSFGECLQRLCDGLVLPFKLLHE